MGSIGAGEVSYAYETWELRLFFMGTVGDCQLLSVLFPLFFVSGFMIA